MKTPGKEDKSTGGFFFLGHNPPRIFSEFDIDPDVQECVYRLWYHDRYVIMKGKTLAGNFFLFQKGFRYYKPDTDPDKPELHEHIYRYMADNPGGVYRIELLGEGNDHYKLLVMELDELRSSAKDKKCLNGNAEPYVPKFNKKTKRFGWLNQGAALNYFKIIKSERQE